ncbi:MAG: CRISPR-associated protein Cas5 [Candidatus Bipolaricaulis sibiricus]|uniref:pre-crRNA processing endonuclease n=1 Tax=Bipolaricaulis sibiricus TaxID=2501609 RepID=A0A410FUE4_BIPS1|nr:MAG: CRISPR-associated protein Cas5 [Candidatus Bipolaricaulis sibiricus]
MRPKDQALDVWGEFACFTRPELKVERFSYPVPTPSAVRGIYDAIYCKRTEFRWQVTAIEVLAPVRYISLRRNEVKDKVSTTNVQQWMTGRSPPEPIWADGTDVELGTDMKGRTQRQTMALCNVHYRLHAEIRPWPGFEDRLQAMEEQFRRRAAGGKCIHQPYFGCREFPAYFDLVDIDAQPPQRQPLDLDIGLMLYDVFDLSRPHGSLDTSRREDPDGVRSISLFRASVRDGLLSIPPYESDAVIKAQQGDTDA